MSPRELEVYAAGLRDGITAAANFVEHHADDHAMAERIRALAPPAQAETPGEPRE